MRNPFRHAKPEPPFRYGDMVRFRPPTTTNEYMVVACENHWAGWRMKTILPILVGNRIGVNFITSWPSTAGFVLVEDNEKAV